MATKKWISPMASPHSGRVEELWIGRPGRGKSVFRRGWRL